MKCHPECVMRPAREVMEGLAERFPGEDIPIPEREGIYFPEHHPDCPNLARLKERGRELAEKYGW